MAELVQTPTGPRYLCPLCGREWESATEAVLCQIQDEIGR